MFSFLYSCLICIDACWQKFNEWLLLLQPRELCPHPHGSVFLHPGLCVFLYTFYIYTFVYFFNYLLFIIYYTLLLLLFMHFLILFSITHVFAHMCVNRHVFSMIYFFCRLWPAPLHSASEDLGRRAAASGRGGSQGEGVFRLHMGGLGPAQEMGVRTAIQACA